MLVVLPRKRDGLASLERQWGGGDAYRQMTEGLDDEVVVIISLPRFKMETEFRLKPVLCGLYAELAFSDEADFSGLGEEPLKISEAVARLDINEALETRCHSRSFRPPSAVSTRQHSRLSTSSRIPPAS